MMERKNRLEYLQLRDSGKSLQEIADMFGVSKQRVHEVLSEKSKREKRTELRQEIAKLEAELTALRDQNAALRALCGRAASAIYHHAKYEPHSLLENLENDLRRAAKEGEGS